MRVMIDACVLYPTVMRDMVLGAADKGLFEPRWSARILEEWARATIKIGPGAETIARGEIARLSARYPNAIVPAKSDADRRFWLPDANDIHVLAAAVDGSCDAILTMNAKDFPRNILAEEGLTRQDPDNFLAKLWLDHPTEIQSIAQNVLETARQLSGEDWTLRKLLKKARLPITGKWLDPT